MKNLIFENNITGELGVVIPSPDAILQSGLNETDFLIAIKNDVVPVGNTFKSIIDETEKPDVATQDWQLVNNVPTMQPVQDNKRHFRGAWIWNGASIVIDAAKETQQRKDKAREIRNELLSKTDSIFMREQEQNGIGKLAMQDRRKDLRDLGAAIDLDPINIVWPDLTVFAL